MNPINHDPMLGTVTPEPTPSRMDQAKETLHNMQDSAQEKLHNLQDSTRDNLHAAGEQAREKMGQAQDQAREIVNQAQARLKGAGKQMADHADNALTSIGDGVHTIASKMRENAPQDPKMRQTLNKVADSLDNGGQYLVDHRISGIQADMTDLIRKHPTQSMAIGIGLGLLLGAALSRRD